MINIKKCKGDNCSKTPIYGLLGKPREYCFNHMIEGCVKEPYKQCESCENLAIFGIKERVRCYMHNNIDDFILIYRRCISCHKNKILNYNMKCFKCDYVGWKTNINIEKIIDSIIENNPENTFVVDSLFVPLIL
jgi:hypothetical protein